MGRPPRETSGHRREQILDEAQKLFVAHGLHDVTTRRIAAAVGISQPSLYAHFPTREAIAVELCCRAFGYLQQRLDAARAQPGSRAEQLRRLGREYIDFGLAHESAYRVAFMLDLPPEAAPEKHLVLAAGLRAFAVLRSVFDGVADAERADMLAQSSWASLHGLVSLMLARREFPWVDRERLIEDHLARLCAAVIANIS